jgi:hypothetical protein
MLILLLSPASLVGDDSGVAEVVNALTNIAQSGVAVAVVSNHSRPEWFDGRFNGTGIDFYQVAGRQSGEVVRTVAKNAHTPTHDILVLAASNADLQMGKNGGAIVLSAQWALEDSVKHLGIDVTSPSELVQIVGLTQQWCGEWWYEGQGTGYKVRALSDLSSIQQSITQKDFSDLVTRTVKHGGAHLSALLAVTARSLLKENMSADRTLFGVYPSSASDNGDAEVLSDFTHRLRTTVARTQFAKREEPLFIRHTPSIRRHSSQASGRDNPTNQVETIHINPFYRDRLAGRHVVVVDDCTTYGVSFGVASAFLLKGGAASVTGIALGKFGNPIQEYSIGLHTSPFEPTSLSTFSSRRFTEKTNPAAQGLLRTLLAP